MAVSYNSSTGKVVYRQGTGTVCTGDECCNCFWQQGGIPDHSPDECVLYFTQGIDGYTDNKFYRAQWERWAGGSYYAYANKNGNPDVFFQIGPLGPDFYTFTFDWVIKQGGGPSPFDESGYYDNDLCQAVQIIAELDFDWNYGTGDTVDAIDILDNGDIAGVGVRSSNKSVWSVDGDGNLNWDYDTGLDTNAVKSDSSNNTIVGGDRDTILFRNIWSLNSVGALNWSYDTTGTITDFGIDGTNVIAIGSRTAAPLSVWSLNSVGALNWSYDTGFSTTSIAVQSGGNVVVTGGSSVTTSLWNIDNTGILSWNKTTGITPNDVIVLASDYVVVVGVGTGDSIVSYENNGTSNWTYDTGSSVNSVAELGTEGAIVAAGAEDTEATKNNVWAIDADGDILWKYNTGSAVNKILATTTGTIDNVYVFMTDTVVALDQDGNFKWEYDSDLTIKDMEVKGSTLYFGSTVGGSEPFGSIWTIVGVNAPLVWIDLYRPDPDEFGWVNGNTYKKFILEQNKGDVLRHFGEPLFGGDAFYYYCCIQDHVGDSDNEPGNGVDWKDYWVPARRWPSQ